MKAGSLLALDLGHVTSAHGNFKAKLCKKDVFPMEIFQVRERETTETATR